MGAPVVYSDVAVIKPSDVTTGEFPTIGSPLKARTFGLTDAGKVRSANEDQFLIARLRKAFQVEKTSLALPKVQDSGDECQLFVVADGMGGHAGGEQASALAIDSVESFVLHTFKWFTQLTTKEENSLLADFQQALGQANVRVLAEAAQHPELHGMGSTLTMAYRYNDRLFVAHVGDSRCYLMRRRALYRLTSDHTLVEEMLQRGALSADEAAHHRWRHVITNAVGANTPEVKVEMHKLYLEPGDMLLLCSDGLTNVVSDDEIAHALVEEDDPEKACQRLVARANEKGGPDNITVIVSQFEEGT